MPAMTLWLSLLFGCIGMGYFVYGKKQSELSFMLAGGLLCCYTYVVSDAIAAVVIGVVLVGVPFAVRRMGE